jgi:hypothetical protein
VNGVSNQRPDQILASTYDDTSGRPLTRYLNPAASSAAPRSITTDESIMTRLGLPTQQTAKTLLSEALQHRHPQWINIPAGSTTIRSFVVFPTEEKTFRL